MYIPKRYGESKVNRCPFCGMQAYAKNSEGVPVCQQHKTATFGAVKCACGSFLELREGKFGPFFTCDRCGIVNMSRALELNPDLESNASTAPPSSSKSPFSKNTQQRVDEVRTKRANAYKDDLGNDVYIRSDDPRFEFK